VCVLQGLHFTTPADVFRITGSFPRVRYFSYQSYDSKGQPLTTLPDYKASDDRSLHGQWEVERDGELCIMSLLMSGAWTRALRARDVGCM
jgi:hypothetical protein